MKMRENVLIVYKDFEDGELLEGMAWLMGQYADIKWGEDGQEGDGWGNRGQQEGVMVFYSLYTCSPLDSLDLY